MQYLLFAGEEYYPKGGWDDYRGSFATAEEGAAKGRAGGWDWWHVVHDGKIVTEDAETADTRALANLLAEED